MQRSLRPLLAAAVLVAPLLAACGDDDTSGTTEPSGTSPDGGGASLTVRAEDSLKFDAGRYETSAGEVQFEYVNDGAIPHTLLIKDVSGFKLGVSSSGETDEGSVELEPGEYTLYCDVPGHEGAGMVATLTVS